MSSYYTDEYTRNIPPDTNVPAGVVLASGTTLVGKTSGYAQNDVIYMCRIPKNAVLLDVIVTWSGESNLAIQVGTSAGVDSIYNAITGTAIGAFSMSGGQQGTSAVTTGLKAASVIRPGYKFTAADYVTVKFTGSAGLSADGTVAVYVQYFMDYGSDLETDVG
jgi:hypothetical protein